jgi:hypothetical protein
VLCGERGQAEESDLAAIVAKVLAKFAGIETHMSSLIM